MLCEKYTQLTPLERATYVGELVHAVQSDNGLFELGEEVIKLAILKGLFDGVKIMPDSTPEIETN